MFFRYTRLRFTLLEMMVVLFLLSIALAVVGIQISRFLNEQRFLNDVNHIVRQLQTAQDFMLVLDTDVNVKIVYNHESKGFEAGILLEKKALKSWRSIVERPAPLLKSIEAVDFESAAGPNEHGTDRVGITIRFPAGGVNMSAGTLILSGTSSNLKQKIVLRGYPSPFQSQLGQEHAFNDFQEGRENSAFRMTLSKILDTKSEESSEEKK